MNITQEKIDEVNAVLKIQLKPEDYKGPLDESIKNYSKKINLPGFRPGKVPAGMVRKMYGKALLADELNRIVSESVDKYIQDQNISLIGGPLPKSENDFDLDWENPSDFEFAFEMGLSPEINLTLPPAEKFTYYDIIVKDEIIDEEIDRLRKQFGEYGIPEITDVNCSVYVQVKELDDAGQIKEGGLTNKAYLLIEKVTDDAVKNQFTGKKIGDAVDCNPVTAIDNKQEVKYLLGLKEKDILEYNHNFRFTIEQIHKVEKAEINEKLFDEVYGEGKVKTEEEFRAKIRAEIAQSYQTESDYKLKHDLEDYFLNTTSINLPDEFLKRWLLRSDKKMTVSKLEKEYGSYARSLKLSLIENKIFKDTGMSVTDEEVENYAQAYIVDKYVRYGQAHLLTADNLKERLKEYLDNHDAREQMLMNIRSRKIFEHLRTFISTETKQVTHQEFVQLMRDHTHEQEHEHTHEHDHSH